MEIDRQKQSKMELELKVAGVQQAEDQKNCMMVDGMAGSVPESAPGASIAKCQRKSTEGQVNLTGARGEPRQEQ